MTNSPPQGIEAVIFDMGGTLVSLPLPIFEYHKKFLKEVCGSHFTVTDEALSSAHDVAAKALRDHLVQSNYGSRYFPTAEDWVIPNRTILQELGVTENLEEGARHYGSLWEELGVSDQLDLNPNVKEVVQELSKRGYKLGIATNWDDPSELLKKIGIFDFFQSIQWEIVDGFCKPSPYMLMLNAKELGVNPLKCAFVGDDIQRDVEAARRAGMTPILLNKEGVEGVEYSVIKDMMELLDFLL